MYVCVSVPGAGTATGVCVSRQGVSGSARLRYKGPRNKPASPPFLSTPLSPCCPLLFCIFLSFSSLHDSSFLFFHLFSQTLSLSFIFCSFPLTLCSLFTLFLLSLPSSCPLKMFLSSVSSSLMPFFLCQAGVSSLLSQLQLSC